MRGITAHISNRKGQTGTGVIAFLIVAIFYLLFATWAAGEWAVTQPEAAAEYFQAEVIVPTVPDQPGVLEYAGFVLDTLWFYLTAFFSFNVAIPVVALISTCILLVLIFIVASILWPF